MKKKFVSYLKEGLMTFVFMVVAWVVLCLAVGDDIEYGKLILWALLCSFICAPVIDYCLERYHKNKLNK